VLKLKSKGPDTDNLDHGEIIIRFWTEEHAKASAVAISEAKQAVQTFLEGENSAIKSMETVMSKLKVFANVTDKAANVHIPPTRFSSITHIAST